MLVHSAVMACSQGRPRSPSRSKEEKEEIEEIARRRKLKTEEIVRQRKLKIEELGKRLGLEPKKPGRRAKKVRSLFDPKKKDEKPATGCKKC